MTFIVFRGVETTNQIYVCYLCCLIYTVPFQSQLDDRKSCQLTDPLVISNSHGKSSFSRGILINQRHGPFCFFFPMAMLTYQRTTIPIEVSPYIYDVYNNSISPVHQTVISLGFGISREIPFLMVKSHNFSNKVWPTYA